MLLLLHANKYIDHEKEKLILIIHVIGLLQHPKKVLFHFNNKIANVLNEVNELKLAMNAFHIARSPESQRESSRILTRFLVQDASKVILVQTKDFIP
jgi:hypothetical protein